VLAIWIYAAVHENIQARDAFGRLQRVFLENDSLEANDEVCQRRAPHGRGA
jgi:hypothetical protein